MKCLSCSSSNIEIILDLIASPPSNSYLKEVELKMPESWYKLCLVMCKNCWLAQLDQVVPSNYIFSDDYAYYSSYSTSWVEHAKQYVKLIIPKLNLSLNSSVVEIACNDGYLLQFFKNTGINFYGVEPTKNTAAIATKGGIEVINDFFTEKLAKQIIKMKNKADLIIANNVLAHVPNINDFLNGFKILLNKNGTITFEFPYFCNLVDLGQFDTIYHEHYFYYSLTSLEPMLLEHGLFIYDLEQVATHGGSLRIYACHVDDKIANKSIAVKNLLLWESYKNLKSMEYYLELKDKVDVIKINSLNFLIDAKKNGKKVLGYGAAAKANTFLNYCGIREDLLSNIVDINFQKQGRFLPGSRIKIMSPNIIKETKPDYIIIFPWNLASEISTQLNYINEWNGKFVTFIPKLKVFQCEEDI
jgi:SAM-dependent methyltransferase